MLSSEEYNIDGRSSVSSSIGTLDEAEGLSILNISSSRTIEDFFFLWFLLSGVDAVVVEGSGGLFLNLEGVFSFELGVLLLLQQKTNILKYYITLKSNKEIGAKLKVSDIESTNLLLFFLFVLLGVLVFSTVGLTSHLFTDRTS